VDGKACLGETKCGTGKEPSGVLFLDEGLRVVPGRGGGVCVYMCICDMCLVTD
jgi:hypothetical protein